VVGGKREGRENQTRVTIWGRSQGKTLYRYMGCYGPWDIVKTTREKVQTPEFCAVMRNFRRSGGAAGEDERKTPTVEHRRIRGENLHSLEVFHTVRDGTWEKGRGRKRGRY